MLYLQQFACFECRKTFKYDVEFTGWRVKAPQAESRLIDNVVCPDCGESMWLMGRKFKAPKRSNIKQWRKVGLRRFPKYLWQADNFIDRFNATQHPPSEGEKLLAKIKRNSGKA
jgi:hypothetical protein